MTISNALVQSVDTPIFTADGQQAVTTVIFCNVSNTQTVTLNMFAVPYGSNAGPATQVLNKVVLPPGETFAMDSERFVLENQDALYATASVENTVCATISSVSTT